MLIALLANPSVSLGHAFPDHADPRVGSVIASSPAQVRIWFDGALEGVFSTLTVQDSSGRRIDKGDGQVSQSDTTLLQVSLPALPAGTYRAVWSAVSRDGHRTSGDFQFTVK